MHSRNLDTVQFTKDSFVKLSKRQILVIFDKMRLTIQKRINCPEGTIHLQIGISRDDCILLLLEIVENLLYRKMQLYDALEKCIFC